MKTEVYRSEFIDYFLKSDTYKNNFSYEGLNSLYDYLIQYEEDTSETIEFDLVALCCDFVEYASLEDYLIEYTTEIDKEEFEEEEFEEAVIKEIQERTTYINVKGTNGFIIIAY